ncbi:MAG: DNA-binding protein [Clostridia bacterium]|nr:DNA-binding protein [Clostridia bacterium]
MQYKRFGDKIFLRLDRGDEIAESIKTVAEKENIAAANISGIGATDGFTVGVFDESKKDYERFSFCGNHEITALVGNISRKGGKVYVHLHITCAGSGGKVVGGHLLAANVSLTAEIIISVASANVSRKHDAAEGINKWSF